MTRPARSISTADLRAKIKGSSGFTLIEVILALSLAGLMFAALSGSFAHTVHTQKLLSGRVTAIILGQGKLAELEAGAESGSSGEFPAPHDDFKWFAAEDSGDDGSVTITLTVEWGDEHGSAIRRKVFTGRRLPE